MKKTLFSFLVCLPLAGWAAGQQNYAAVILPGLGEPSIGAALKINNAGQIAGWSNDSNGNPHAVLWSPAPKGGYYVQDLGTLGGAYSYAYGLNDRGEVVGSATVATGEEYAFFWRKGNMTNLGTIMTTPWPNHGWFTLSQANAINNAGQIVGYSVVDESTIRAFLWQDGAMQDLGSLGPVGNQRSHATDINNQGDIAGWSTTGWGEDGAVLWQQGQMTKLDSEALTAYGINERGQIAGMGGGPLNLGAFRWQDGLMSRCGVGDSIAYGINERGEVVGSYLKNIDWENGTYLYMGFVWGNGGVSDLPLPPQAASGYAAAINNQGQVAGYIVGQDWFYNPVVWVRARPESAKP